MGVLLVMWAVSGISEVGQLSGHTIGNIWRIVHSPDGALVASLNNVELMIWDAATRTQRAAIPIDGGGFQLNGLAFSDDGQQVAVGVSKRIAFFDARTGKPTHDVALEGPGGVGALAMKGDTLVVSAAGEGGNMVAFADSVYEGGKRTKQLAKGRYTADISWRGDRVGFAFGGGIEVYDSKTWKRLAQQRYKKEATRIAFTPDASFFVTGSIDRSLRVYDVQGKLKKEWVAHEGAKTNDIGYIQGVAVSEHFIVSASDDKEGVRLWDPKTFAQLASTETNVGRLSAMSLSPDGKTLVVGGTAKKLQVLSLAE